MLLCEKGRAFMDKLMGGQNGIAKSQEEHTRTLGEGSAEMVQNTMLGMPLHAIVTFGRMTQEQLQGLLAMLNS